MATIKTTYHDLPSAIDIKLDRDEIDCIVLLLGSMCGDSTSGPAREAGAHLYRKLEKLSKYGPTNPHYTGGHSLDPHSGFLSSDRYGIHFKQGV